MSVAQIPLSVHLVNEEICIRPDSVYLRILLDFRFNSVTGFCHPRITMPRTDTTKRLEAFKFQFYLLFYVDKFTMDQVTALFNWLFSILNVITGEKHGVTYANTFSTTKADANYFRSGKSSGSAANVSGIRTGSYGRANLVYLHQRI